MCDNWRPYAQALKTMTLGCVNCGSLSFHHSNICLICGGTGRGLDVKKAFDDNTSCDFCHGSGRTDGFWKPM